MEKAINVDAYIKNNLKQKALIVKLRNIILKTTLTETIKWGMPTYSYGGKNLLGIGAFMNHVGLWFFQGGLLNDTYNLLINAQEGKTKAMRQMRFEKLDEIKEKIILEYIDQTIANHKKGLVIKSVRKTEKLKIPKELLSVFKNNSKLEASFSSLTPGKKREYAEHVASAKRDSTKLKRIEKIIPLIHEKKGLYDKYKNC